MNGYFGLRAATLLILLLPFAGSSLSAQDKVHLSGYLQPQFQYGEKDATLKVGAENTRPDRPFNRVGIRRGRIKLTYEETLAAVAVQVDASEKGIILKDAYVHLTEPWLKASALRAGVFEPPFGNEIAYSSARRESPESSLLFQTLFPEERDMGVMLQLRAAPSSPWRLLTLDMALLAGNGAKMETDNRKDFIAHLHASHDIGNAFRIAGGLSYYRGGVYQGTETVYRMQGKAFVADSDPRNMGRFAGREYRGIDIQLNMPGRAWPRQLRAEYIDGYQPGSATGMQSRNASTLPAYDTYVRHFRGGYVIFVQDIARTPFSAVLKYEWLDPNTCLSNGDVGQHNSTEADIRRNTLGLGMLWQPGNRFRLQACYEINRNETSANLAGYDRDRKDNVLTLRLQYRF
jgi:phosphate-selective porin